MTRSSENRCFRRFHQTRDPRLLAKVFDATAAELLRVAGHLSNGDRELTQDALQATFLTAIEKAGSYDTERDVRPWLLGILANHVRKERRRTLRHRGSDVTEAGLQVKGSLVADVQSAEFGTAAKAAMKKLPAPFKEAIVLHLVHGLTATEIAEALGRPAGTVRTQVVRGMDRLRALLPAGFTAAALGMMLTPGPVLAAVRSNVLATLPPVAIASSSFFLAGWRLYAMIAASLTVALSILFSLLSDPLPELPVNTARVKGEAPVLATVAVGTPRELVATALPGVVQPAPLAKVKPQRPANLQRVALKVVYKSDGVGAANVPVATRVNGTYKTFYADDKGRCELWLPWPGGYELYVVGTHARASFNWFNGLQRPRVHKERIEIEPGMNLDVRVTDDAGKPLAGATVESTHGMQMGGMMLTVLGKTDTNGRLQRRDIPVSGQMRIWSPGHLLSRIRQVKGKVGKVTEAKFQLKGGAFKARGRVVDENGKPIAGARLALVPYTEAPYLPQFLASDRAGNFELHTMKKGKHVLVGIHHEDKVRRGVLRFVHDGIGEKQLELRLTRGARVIGVLKNAVGQPMVMTNVTARHRPDGLDSLPFMETFTRTAGDGSFELNGLLPSSYELEVDKVPPQSVTLRDGETYQWNPKRTALLPISFRLLDTQGKPLEGWKVSMVPPGTDYASDNTITGADGRAQYVPQGWKYAPGSHCRFYIFKKLGKHADKWQDTSRLPSLQTPPLMVGQEHEIRVPASAHAMHDIVGTILDASGAPLKSATVSMAGVLGWSYSSTALVDAATGAFQFEDLPPGRYNALVRVPGKPRYILPSIDVAGDRVVSFGRINVPDVGRVVVTLPVATSSKGLKLQVVGAAGDKFDLKQRSDGSWRSALIYHGDYQLRGWSAETMVVPQSLALSGDSVATQAKLVQHAVTLVVVELPSDYSRSGSGWSGKLTARAGTKIVWDHSLDRRFADGFESRMEFLVPLPVGDLNLRVKSWNKSIGTARVQIPVNGGGEVLVQIR